MAKDKKTGFVLPDKKEVPKVLNPRKLLLYGPPKVGKTTLMAELEDSLLVDIDKSGSSFVEAVKVEVNSLADFGSLIRALRESPGKYKYGILDTVTILEELAQEYALQLYRASPMGSKFGLRPDGTYEDKDILTLPQGAGYHWLRVAFFKLIEMFDSCFEYKIYIGHLRDKQIDEATQSVTAANVDLTGKIRSLMCAQSDSVGYIYRQDNETVISFNPKGDITCGSRSPHLRNKDIVVAKMDLETQEYTTYWDKIFVK